MHKPSIFPPFNSTEKEFTKASIEKILRSQFTSGSCLQILESGSMTFQKILDTVASARKSICIEFYIFRTIRGKNLPKCSKQKSDRE